MDSRELALKAAAFMEERKAGDILLLEIAENSAFADFMLIVSGGSERQVGSLADLLEDELAQAEILPRAIEGRKESGWILMDYGDIVVNIFTKEMRERYNLEKLWRDCPVVELAFKEE